MAEALDVVEHEYGTRTWRKCRDRSLEVDPRIGVFRSRDPSIGGSIHLCSRLVVPLIVGQHHARPPSTVRSCLDEDLVHGDSVQPGGQLRFPADRSQSIPGADEDALGNFARACSIRRHAEAERVNAANLSPVDVLERIDVAGPGALDQPRVIVALRALVPGWDRGHGFGRVLPGEVRRHPGSWMPPRTASLERTAGDGGRTTGTGNREPGNRELRPSIGTTTIHRLRRLPRASAPNDRVPRLCRLPPRAACRLFVRPSSPIPSRQSPVRQSPVWRLQANLRTFRAPTEPARYPASCPACLSAS